MKAYSIDKTSGKKTFLGWEESCRRLHARLKKATDKLHYAGIQMALLEHKLVWEKDKVEILQHELETYKVAYLQEDDELKQRVIKIGRILHNKDKYTKKQMVEAMDAILLQE